MFKSETNSFSKDSEYLKSLDIGLREVGAKRPLNGVRKCDGQTKNRQTDTRTLRLIESIGLRADALKMVDWSAVKCAVSDIPQDVRRYKQVTGIWN